MSINNDMPARCYAGISILILEGTMPPHYMNFIHHSHCFIYYVKLKLPLQSIWLEFSRYLLFNDSKDQRVIHLCVLITKSIAACIGLRKLEIHCDCFSPHTYTIYPGFRPFTLHHLFSCVGSF